MDFRTAKRKTGRGGGLSHGEVKNRAARWTFPRRSGEVRGAGLLSHGEAAKFGGRGLSHGEAANWGAEPLRAYKRKEKAQAAKGDETANFVTKGRRGRRRLVAGSSPNGIRNVAGKTWLFGRKGAKMAVPKGKKAKSPQGRPPKPPKGLPPTTTRPNVRSQRKKGNEAPRPSPTAREVSLGAPNDRTFPLGAERRGKPAKSDQRRNQP